MSGSRDKRYHAEFQVKGDPRWFFMHGYDSEPGAEDAIARVKQLTTRGKEYRVRDTREADDANQAQTT